MKTLSIFILGLFLAITIKTEAKEKASFGGKLIKENKVIVFEKSDGSEITTINNVSYLSKASTPSQKLPSYVRKERPQPLIYESSSGNEYLSLDGGEHWTKYDSEKFQTTNAETEPNNQQNLSLVYHPENPVTDNFLIKFSLKSSSNIEFKIINIQGIVVKSLTKLMNSGINIIEMNLSNISSGAYFYEIKAGNDVMRKKFIKM
jgi:hypothetical protein